MKSYIGIRITAEVNGDGPAILRRVLTEMVGMIERNEIDLSKVPVATRLGDVLIEIGAGPAPPDAEAAAPVAPSAPNAPESAQVQVVMRD